MTLGLDAGMLCLAKGERFDESDREPSQTIGFSCLRCDSKTVLLAIESDSFADNAWLKTGDELLKVNGKSLHGMPMTEIIWRIRTYAAASGESVGITILRDETQQELILSLKTLIQELNSQLIKATP